MTSVLLPDVDDEPTDLAEPSRCEIVAEALATFGEDAAGELAALLGVTLADCAAEIEELRCPT